MEQGLGQANPLALPFGQFADAIVGAVGNMHQIHGAVDGIGPLGHIAQARHMVEVA